jgi:hypothetical protein
MFTRIAYTWDLMKASWDVLKKDKGLLLFPLLSGVSCLAVLASFAIPYWLTAAGRPHSGAAGGTTWHFSPAHYIVLFAFYFCNYFVITFFNSAIIACAIERMRGGEPTVGYGFSIATQRLPLILGWSAVAATVGLVLRIIEDKSDWVGALVAGLLGFAWTLVSYLAIPIMVVEGTGPIASLKESGQLLRQTWGEQLVSRFGFGMIFGLLSIPAFLLIGGGVAAGISTQSLALGIFMVGFGIIYLLGLSLINSALQAIFQAAVYLYAREGQAAVPGFPVMLLQNAMSRK